METDPQSSQSSITEILPCHDGLDQLLSNMPREELFSLAGCIALELYRRAGLQTETRRDESTDPLEDKHPHQPLLDVFYDFSQAFLRDINASLLQQLKDIGIPTQMIGEIMISFRLDTLVEYEERLARLKQAGQTNL